MVDRSAQSEIINGYQMKEVVGEGQYGQVIHCVNREGLHLAVKKIPLHKVQGDRHLHGLLDQETRVLLQVMHQHIIEFIESFTHAGYLWIVYEFCNRGSIKSIIANQQYMEETNALVVTRSVLLALAVLAQKGLVHRDVKPDNILVKEDTIKLADFGFCVEESNLRRGLVGSPAFMSPEAISDNLYTCKGDVYALGVTLYIMLTGKLPFCERQLNELFHKKINFNIMSDPSPISPLCRELLARMLAPLEWRSSAADALAFLDASLPALHLYRPNFVRRQAQISHYQQQPVKRTTVRSNPLQTRFMMPSTPNLHQTKIEPLKGDEPKKERVGSHSRDRYQNSSKNDARSRDPVRSKSTKHYPFRHPLKVEWSDTSMVNQSDQMSSQAMDGPPSFLAQEPQTQPYFNNYYPPNANY